MIVSMLADYPLHSDLMDVHAIDGIAFVQTTIAPASFLVLCSDSTMLALRYMACSDVLHALRQKQLDALMLSLREQSPWAYLLIGGVLTPNADGQIRNQKGAITGWTWDAYQGALMAVQEMGVGIVTLQHAQLVPAMISRLAKRARTPKRVKPLRDVLWSDPATEILTSLPGIGEEKADAILKTCGTAANALDALSNGIPLPGIGPETRRKAREALGLADGQGLYIATAQPILT